MPWQLRKGAEESIKIGFDTHVIPSYITRELTSPLLMSCHTKWSRVAT